MVIATETNRDAVVSQLRDELSSSPALDIAGIVELLLNATVRVGSIRMAPNGNAAASIEVADAPAFVLPFARAFGRVRGICANLAVRCGDQVSIYGGEGDIEVPGSDPPCRVFARWTNTP